MASTTPTVTFETKFNELTGAAITNFSDIARLPANHPARKNFVQISDTIFLAGQHGKQTYWLIKDDDLRPEKLDRPDETKPPTPLVDKLAGLSVNRTQIQGTPSNPGQVLSDT